MPCVPIGMTVMCGRTSRLNRFLSMPRYDGASRSRIRRGLPTYALTAGIHGSEASDTVQIRLSLSSDTDTPSEAGLSVPSRVACAGAFQRKAHLAPRQSDWPRPACGVAAHEPDIFGKPIKHVASQPADPPAAKTLPSRKAPEQRQRCEYPTMSAREPGNVMGGQQFLKGGKFLIDPFRE